jgi:hypothetical protein
MSENKEEFCGACVAGLVALAGAGTTGVSSTGAKKNVKKKRIMFWISLSVTLISICFLIYFMYFKKCNECA